MKIKNFLVSELKVNFFVRVTPINENYIFHLAELYQNGAKIAPIQVTPEGEIVDGRHRFEAQKLIDRKEIQCEIIVGKHTQPELIVMALRANMGGSVPPSRADICHTIKMLFEEGVSRPKISELVNKMIGNLLPPSLLRRYLDDAQSAIASERMRRAVSAVAEGGMTVPAAARKYGASEDDLRDLLTGKKRKKSKLGLNDMKAKISLQFRSNSQKWAKKLQELFIRFEDGEVSDKQLSEVIDCIDNCISKSQKSLRKWYDRLDARKKQKS